MMVTMAAPAAPLRPARGPHIHLAADRRQNLGVAFLDFGLVGQRAGIGHIGAGGVHGAGRDRGQQFMCARLAQIGLRGGQVLAPRSRRPGGLQRGHLLVASLRAHNALLGQRHGAAGVGLLMLELALAWASEASAAFTCASALTVALWFRRCSGARYPRCRSASTSGWLARGLGSLQRRLKVIALDDGDQLAGLYGVAFFTVSVWMRPGILALTTHLVGVHGADQLQVAGRPDRDEGTRSAIPWSAVPES
jgi:hypothetical protein